MAPALDTVAEPPADEQAEEEGKEIRFGPVTLGGAMRVNYIHGDYIVVGKAPQRGGNGGNVELDTFRINASLESGHLRGALEYRWYDGYNFLHTGWLGYEFDEAGQIQVGVTRVPFGPGPYGVSQSWFFDQHYYVGLSDDLDLGIKYLTEQGDWDLALAYFQGSEGDWNGASADSARYSYDVVRWRSAILDDGSVVPAIENGYSERSQINGRVIHHFRNAKIATDLGLSMQRGRLRGRDADDGDHWAVSAHMVNKVCGFTLASQLTRYKIDIGEDNLLGTSELVPMGAYDFAWPVATDAWIPAISLSYKYTTETISWLDYVLPYIEYSAIRKESEHIGDSELVAIGAAWANGNWYIYTDYVRSNGNLFVGNEGDDFTNIFDGVGDFGIDGNDRWNSRLNINFGYYF